MAGWPAEDPATPAAVTALLAEANHRLAAVPDEAWTAMSDLSVMAVAFTGWRTVDALATRSLERGVSPCLLLQRENDEWLLVTGARDRLCASRSDRPARPYRLVVHPQYHRYFTGTFAEMMAALCAATPAVGWHRLPWWVADAVARHGSRPDAADAEAAVGRQAGEWAAAAWTMHRLTTG